MLLAVSKKTIQCPDAVWHKIMWFKEVEILKFKVNKGDRTGAREGRGWG